MAICQNLFIILVELELLIISSEMEVEIIFLWFMLACLIGIFCSKGSDITKCTGSSILLKEMLEGHAITSEVLQAIYISNTN